MDYIKQEEPPPQMYPAVSEPLTHSIVYQNQQLPLNLVEQIQLAVQSNIAEAHLGNMLIKNQDQSHVHILRSESRGMHASLEPDHRNAPMIQAVEHRSIPTAVQDVCISQDRTALEEHGMVQDHRVQASLPQRIQSDDHRIQIQHVHRPNLQDGRLSQLNMVQLMQGRVAAGLPDIQRMSAAAELPQPFQIKAEQDVEENPYFYDQIVEAYTSNGNVQIEYAPNNIVAGAHHDNHTLQYVFNGHVANVNVPTLAADAYARQQPFYHSYADSEGNAENLVVHRQFEHIYAGDANKRERTELAERTHQPADSHDENAKPKNYYYDAECYGGKSENDAGVQNKMAANPDDAAYKSLIEAEYANIKGEYICVKCNGIFPSKRGLKQHSKSCADSAETEPSEKAGKFCCAQCPYKCQSPAILKIHERTHTGEKPFSCNFCDYKSGQKNNVAKHILVHMKEKPFRCQYCDYRCAQKNNLVVHERTHTGFKPFACTLCDYKTVQKPNLVKHMYLHTGQKPFSCDVCSYKCVQKTNLTKHKQRHLNDKGDKPEYVNKNANRPYRPRQKTFKCDYCSFRCVQKQGLDKHVHFKHGDQGLDAERHAEAATGEYSAPDKRYDVQIQGLNLMKSAELDAGSKDSESPARSELYAAPDLVSAQGAVLIPS